MAPIIQKTTTLNRIAPNASTIPFLENNSLQHSQSTSAISSQLTSSINGTLRLANADTRYNATKSKETSSSIKSNFQLADMMKSHQIIADSKAKFQSLVNKTNDKAKEKKDVIEETTLEDLPDQLITGLEKVLIILYNI